jgi:hypothetical protein
MDFTKVYAAVYTEKLRWKKGLLETQLIKGLLQLKEHFKPEGGCSFIS